MDNALTAARLILVKHSLPEIAPGVPASEWHLSPAGRARCAPLAELLAAYDPTVVVGSREPKATQTATLVAAHLHRPCETAPDLHEHDRQGVGYLDPAAFAGAVRAFFVQPDQLVFGRETANQARARFAGAVGCVLARFPRDTVVIVAHGTVITLFVGEPTAAAAFARWQRLGLPSFVVLGRPAFGVLAEVDAVA